jgi:hypothetical protein
MQRLIRLVHDNDGLVVANNLLSGSSMRKESDSPMRIEDNVIKDFTQWLADPAAGNLHLKPGAADVLSTVKRLADVPQDIDGQQRPEKTVVGADQP